MAVYDLEEQEQIDQLKAWWAQYGNKVVTALLVVVLGYAGWTVWNRYQDSSATGASLLYFKLQQAVGADDEQRTIAFAGELKQKYGDTVQAQLGALLSASMEFRKNNPEGALDQLAWVADKGRDVTLRDLARLRQAAILFQKNQPDEALARLQSPSEFLRGRFEDLRGDIFAAQGRVSEARTAWQAAIEAFGTEAVGEGAALRNVVRIKLESLKG